MSDKCVLISVRPKWCEMEASGKKTLEVRKNRPKMETPFKCYIYCTKQKAKHALHVYVTESDFRNEYGTTNHWRSGADIVDVNSHLPAYRHNEYLAEGKVIGEFVCDYVLSIYPPFGNKTEGTCLSAPEMYQYAEHKTLYGWHISALQIYDKPRELNEFYFPPEKYCEKELCGGCPHDQMPDVNGEYAYDCEWRRPITRAPQSWAYVEEYDGKR